jgi:transposase
MEVLYPRCAGLDVHKRTVVACVILSLDHGKKQLTTRTFGTTTRDLLALRDWLQEQGCTHVAMESTGEYWKPVYNILEGAAELLLVNPQHCKNVPGRKTDVGDAAWLADLLRHGLVRSSFVPPRPQRHLRDLTRGRSTLVEERARVINRLQKVLEDANLKLASVVTDITGVSAMEMLEGLIAGETDPKKLAQHARCRMRRKLPELEAALEGKLEIHHRFLLSQHLLHLKFLNAQVAAFDTQVVAHMAAMLPEAEAGAVTPRTVPEAGRKGGTAEPGNVGENADEAPAKPPRPATPPPMPLGYAAAVALLDPVPGLARRAIECILAETGTDMSRFPSAGHLTSWAGVSPGNRESGGKRYSGKTRHGNHALRQALVQAAHGARAVTGSYFHALYHRLAPRRGKKRAILAVARSLLVVIYEMLRWQEPYWELGAHYFDTRDREAKAKGLARQLRKLGYEVDLEAMAVGAT